jgi:hypothetical protein
LFPFKGSLSRLSSLFHRSRPIGLPLIITIYGPVIKVFDIVFLIEHTSFKAFFQHTLGIGLCFFYSHLLSKFLIVHSPINTSRSILFLFLSIDLITHLLSRISCIFQEYSSFYLWTVPSKYLWNLNLDINFLNLPYLFKFALNVPLVLVIFIQIFVFELVFIG